MDYKKQVEIATESILKRLNNVCKIDIALILGSGLGSLADEIENPIIIPYNEVPHLPTSTVQGHKGQFVIGKLQNKTVIAMQGRFHSYEGYSQKKVTFPVRIFKELGIKNLIITNAAGGVNLDFKPGDLMIIKDHINFTFTNPLIGKNYIRFGPRFPDTSTVYDNKLSKIAKDIGKNLNIKEGVYLFTSGPTYETPAEIRMARILGADAVGMSTVPESIVAAHAGIDVLGISLITNMASGILNKPLEHSEVIATAAKSKIQFINFIKLILERI